MSNIPNDNVYSLLNMPMKQSIFFKFFIYTIEGDSGFGIHFVITRIKTKNLMSSNTNNNESLSLKKSLKYKKGDALM
jgi:hypothetical protein